MLQLQLHNDSNGVETPLVLYQIAVSESILQTIKVFHPTIECFMPWKHSAFEISDKRYVLTAWDWKQLGLTTVPFVGNAPVWYPPSTWR